MTIWLTADHHFGHKKIINYCDRPFKSLKHMEGKLIKNHNALVSKNDTVYVLGDFCFCNKNTKLEHYINRLNGNLIFIKGNHDSKKLTKIDSVNISIGKLKANLVHNPRNHKGQTKLCINGHVHKCWKFSRNNKGVDFINVGLDQWNFRPVRLDKMYESYKKWRTSVSKMNFIERTKWRLCFLGNGRVGMLLCKFMRLKKKIIVYLKKLTK